MQNSLTSAQKDNVMGKKQVSSGAANGDNTIAPDATLTQASITTFLKDAARNADISLYSPSPERSQLQRRLDVELRDQLREPGLLGHGRQAQGRVHQGRRPDPTSAFTALTLNGNVTGYGVLIVEDGDLKVLGNFNWYGLVIVTGQWVGVGFMGSLNGTDQYVYGSVISNETSTDPLYEGVVYADAKLRYSCQALTNGVGARASCSPCRAGRRSASERPPSSRC